MQVVKNSEVDLKSIKLSDAQTREVCERVCRKRRYDYKTSGSQRRLSWKSAHVKASELTNPNTQM